MARTPSTPPRAGLPDMVQLCAELGGNVNTRSHAGGTPMLKAAQNGHVDVMHLLRALGADIFAADEKMR